MISITFNGRQLELSTPEERALRSLSIGSLSGQWVCHKSHFEEGPRKYRRYILPNLERPYIDGAYRISRAEELGVSMVERDNEWDVISKRADAFFAANPRHRFCVEGNPRRINAILQAIDTIRAAKVAK